MEVVWPLVVALTAIAVVSFDPVQVDAFVVPAAELTSPPLKRSMTPHPWADRYVSRCRYISSASRIDAETDTGAAFQSDRDDAKSAAERYSGAGEALVDMNAYNIPLSRAAEEWVANYTPETMFLEAGIYLGAKSKKELFVDTLTFPVRRAGGLGLELLELAGGRDDGLGITVVEGLVPGGNADGCGILPGDSISQLTLRRKRGNNDGDGSTLRDDTDEFSVSAECLGFESTIEAIVGLPPIETDDELLLITVKRLRRKPTVTVTLRYPPAQNEPDTTITLFAGENLRRAMLTRGVKLNDALSRRFDSGGMGDCGAEGTCATCVVSVTDGMALLNPIGQQEKQILAKKPKWRMACKSIVGFGMKEGKMTMKVNPKQWDE